MTAAANCRADSCLSLDSSFTRILSRGISSSNQRRVFCTLAIRKSFVNILSLHLIFQIATCTATRKSPERYPFQGAVCRNRRLSDDSGKAYGRYGRLKSDSGGDTRCERYDIRGFSGLREAASGLALVFSEAFRVPQP